MHAADKKLNEMNRLSDMGRFPPLVNAGATLNVLFTLCLTWYLVPRHPQPYAAIVWIAVVLVLNLLPVALLRLTLTPSTPYPRLADMDFVHDQHKFSDWVYVPPPPTWPSGSSPPGRSSASLQPCPRSSPCLP